MTLINCPECSKEISERAVACPNCGFPLQIKESTNLINVSNNLKYPDFPADLSIGKQRVNWLGDAVLSGEFNTEDNIVREITPGKINILMHQKGFQITSFLYRPFMELHFSQIINTRFADTSELIRQDKSVIGRAAVGGLIMGPLGAIIGGMSGTGSKSVKRNSYLIINYWELKIRTPQTILIRGNDSKIRSFVGRLNTEITKFNKLNNH